MKFFTNRTRALESKSKSCKIAVGTPVEVISKGAYYGYVGIVSDTFSDGGFIVKSDTSTLVCSSRVKLKTLK